jgi:hypothetical protein
MGNRRKKLGVTSPIFGKVINGNTHCYLLTLGVTSPLVYSSAFIGKDGRDGRDGVI